MKIAFLGNFRVDYTSESHYLKTFRKLGHEVMLLQEGIDNISQIMKRAAKMDMFFWVHTHGWNTEGMAEGIQILKEEGIPTVGYHLDLWLGIQRQKDLMTDPYWNIDYFFTVDKLMADYLNSKPELPKAFYLPPGVFEDEAYIEQYEKELDHDVVFVGSRGYHPEWPYRTKLLDWLAKTYGNRFAHYGRDGLGEMRGKNLNALYASSKVIVGDTLCKDFSYPYYLSDRIFETTGRGGFIIHPQIKGLEDLFVLPEQYEGSFDTSKAELITYPYDNFEYLKYAIDYYLQNEEERNAIRLRGQERTRSSHTYTNRLQFILDTIKNERD